MIFLLFVGNFDRKSDKQRDDLHQTLHIVAPDIGIHSLCLYYRHVHVCHCDNTPMQYTALFQGCKNDNFQMNYCDTFLIFAFNIGSWYTLEPPQ